MLNKKITALILSFCLTLGLCPQGRAAADSEDAECLLSAEISDNMLTISGTTPEECESVSIVMTEKSTTRGDISEIDTNEALLTALKNFYVTEGTDYKFTKSLSCEAVGSEFKMLITSENMLFEKTLSKSGAQRFALENYSIDEDGGITVFGASDGEAHIYVLSAEVFSGNVSDAIAEEKIADYVIAETVKNGEYSHHFAGVFNEANEAALLVKTAAETAVYKVHSSYIHISPSGSDADGNGSLKSPFATIGYAKQYLRERDINREVYVIVHGGVYTLNSAVLFAAEDSGTQERPITYMAAKNEKAVFSGAKTIDASQFNPVEDSIRQRLKGGAAENAVMLDLDAAGIDADILPFRREGADGGAFRYVNVFLNDKRQDICGWPNGGKFKITDVTKGEGKQRCLTIEGLDTSKWQLADNIYMYGCTGTWWNHEWNEISSFSDNADELIISTFATDPTTYRGESYGNPQYTGRIINVLEEMDMPGEWYLDVDNAKLYYYPPHKLGDDDTLEIAVLDDDLFDVAECEYINFSGLTFEKNVSNQAKTNSLTINAGHGIHIEKSNNINISKCRFNAIGVNGINAEGKNITVDGCVISDVGRNGIYVKSDNCRENITETGITVSNNIVSKVSREQGGNEGVGICLANDNVGTVVRNNIVHDTQNIAVRYGGLQNRIAYNEIYNAMNDSSDSGAIYAGRSWADFGNVIEYNYIHDYGPKNADESPAWHAAGIYWDDRHIGNTARFNIIVPNNTYDGYIAYINGGAENTFEKNISANAKAGVYYAASGISNVDIGTCEDRVLEIPYNSEVYLEKYPKINEIYTKWKNQNKFYSYNYLKNNFNVGAEGEFSGPTEISLWNKTYNTTDKDIDYTDAVFIKTDRHDYRVTDAAKNNYSLRDDLPGADFDMALIGTENKYIPTGEDKEFELLYPQNRQASVNPDKITLVWEESAFADEYDYFVYSDADCKKLVASGSTRYENAEVGGLEYGGIYYWKVIAKNTSKDISFEESSELFCFFAENNPIISDAALLGDTISFKAENQNETAASFTVLAAVRNSQKELVYVKSEAYTLPEKGAFEKSIKTEFEGLTADDIVELFVWYGANSMRPVTEKITVKNK